MECIALRDEQLAVLSETKQGCICALSSSQGVTGGGEGGGGVIIYIMGKDGILRPGKLLWFVWSSWEYLSQDCLHCFPTADQGHYFFGRLLANYSMLLEDSFPCFDLRSMTKEQSQGNFTLSGLLGGVAWPVELWATVFHRIRTLVQITQYFLFQLATSSPSFQAKVLPQSCYLRCWRVKLRTFPLQSWCFTSTHLSFRKTASASEHRTEITGFCFFDNMRSFTVALFRCVLSPFE